MQDGSGGPGGAWNFVPVWDGRPETFSHFIHEVKWSLSSSRKEDRALLGAKIIRKALQSGQPTLVQLMYKLEPHDFVSEEDVQKLIRYLEESPLNRQALPDAGNKIGGYYRRLRKRLGETVPQFLVREDRTHDEMMRALQRLLREKELDFDTYDVTVDELKVFCGIKEGQSLYFGPDEHDDVASQRSNQSSRTETPQQSGVPFSGRDSTRGKGTGSSSTAETSGPQGKDLLQRLMEKGLIPLAALDVVRGWMLLEMATMGEDDRRIIRAATRNRLGYSEIRSALLSMFEEKAHRIPLDPRGKGGKVYAMHEQYDPDSPASYDEPEGEETVAYQGQDDWYHEDNWYQDPGWNPQSSWDEWNWDDAYYQGWDAQGSHSEAPADLEHDEAYVQLMKEQEEAERSYHDLQALVADNERSLADARKAVANAARDRGWNPPQQRQSKPTSTYPGKSFKGKGKGYMQQKGKYSQDVAWMKGSKSPKGSGKMKGHVYKGSYKGSKGSGKGNDAYFLHWHDMFAATTGDEVGPSESIVDTGATATAGGQWAVQQLCQSVMKSAPDAVMEVYTERRPWFRFGNGRWGQALYRVLLTKGDIQISIYALPSPGVPVLTGMRDLKKMKCILNTETAKGVVNGKLISLRETSKGHLILDYMKHIFCDHAEPPREDIPTDYGNNPSNASARSILPKHRIKINKESPQTRTGSSSVGDNHFAEVHDLWMFDIDTSQYDLVDSTCDFSTSSPDMYSFMLDRSDDVASHLGISSREVHFLLQPPNISSQTSKSIKTKRVSFNVETQHGRDERRDEEDDERSPQGDLGGSTVQWISNGSTTGKGKARIQEEDSKDRVRRDTQARSRPSRSSSEQGSLAVQRSPCVGVREQQVWKVGAVCNLCCSPLLHASCRCPCSVDAHGSSTEHHRSFAQVEGRWIRGQRPDGSPGESHDHHRCQGEDLADQEGEPEGCPKEDRQEDSGDGGHDHGRLGQGVVLGGRITGEAVREVDHSHQEPMGSHVTHHEDAGEEACIRDLSVEEKKQLHGAAHEFKTEATLASLQDLDTPSRTVWEVCCRLNSTLANECLRQGLHAERKTIENGYDMEKLETAKRLCDERRRERPRRMWLSLKCTEWTNIQYINQRTERQIEMLRKRRQKARKMAKNALMVVEEAVKDDDQFRFYWEWPKNATEGWRLDVMVDFLKKMKALGIRLYWTEMHGCAFGMKTDKGELLNKAWYIMTNDENFNYHGQTLCPGDHQHREGGAMGPWAVRALKLLDFIRRPW